MHETLSGNGKQPEGERTLTRQSQTQPANTFAYMDRLMAERSAVLAQGESDPAQPTSPLAAPNPVDEDVTLLDDPSLQLMMRFLLGSAIIGAEELLVRVRRWDAQARLDPLARSGKPFEEATNLELARYLVIGSLVWGRKLIVHAVRTNLIGSQGRPPVLLKSIDRITARWPLTAFREPVRQAVTNFSTTADQRIREGWQEEQAARWLANKTINEIIDDFINHISENPELAALVRDQINQQSIGLASTVRDAGREWSVVGDDLIEAVVRRLFRRRPRSELPDSKPAIAKADVEDGRDD